MEFARRSWQSEELGLLLVHKLKHHDAEMRWLAKLFPFREGGVPLDIAEQTLGSWCEAHPDDARARAHLENIGDDISMMEEASAMGDAWATTGEVFDSFSEEKKFELARASAEKGDAEGTYRLMECFQEGIGCERNEVFAEELLKCALDLGSCFAFSTHARSRQIGPQRRVELLMSFFGLYSSGRLEAALEHLLQQHARDGMVNRDLIFEVGEMYKGNLIWREREKKRFGEGKGQNLRGVLEAVDLYDKWCGEVREEWCCVGFDCQANWSEQRC